MDICVIERAAETLLSLDESKGPPNLVSAESRREAEQLFHNIKQELTIEAAGQVIQNTKNQCVLFQIAQMTGEIVLRDWVLLSKEQIIHTYKMLLEFVAQREDLSNYAQTEFLRSVAMILKRGIIDEKTGDQEELFELIHNLLINQHARLLHSKIRTDEDLSIRSLSCLVQLAGLSGEVMASSEFTEHYVKHYIGSLMDLFAEGPLPHEINYFCTIVNRLFQYRPIQTIMRVGPELRRKFLIYLSQYIQHLTNQAMYTAIGRGEHDDHHSLALLFDSWTLLLRGRWRLELSQEEETLIDNELIIGPNLQIVKRFVECVQAPPIGCRAPIFTGGDDDDEDDRTLFLDLLTPLGTMACYSVREFMDMMIQ
ncbi:hypothetical protein TELCIR_13736 [Teladorsagia circumcincta]|uniref:Exportin-1 C-terminal domain-containing protein n=1 Tax=Teladorsagia circumcincta TaxID=45464 RepID=A0A2G9U540_TELCI|nr:hypothetical protein TELCIR_13736 [Teladorsagia circumcincta]